MSRRREIEKILDRDYRSSIKYWTAYQVAVQESLRTGVLPDGTVITDRPEIEGIAAFIEENLHRIREHIDGLEEFGEIAVKAIGEWMSGVDEDTVIRDFSAKADELTKIKNMEKQTREKWK